MGLRVLWACAATPGEAPGSRASGESRGHVCASTEQGEYRGKGALWPWRAAREGGCTVTWASVTRTASRRPWSPGRGLGIRLSLRLRVEENTGWRAPQGHVCPLLPVGPHPSSSHPPRHCWSTWEGYLLPGICRLLGVLTTSPTHHGAAGWGQAVVGTPSELPAGACGSPNTKSCSS